MYIANQYTSRTEPIAFQIAFICMPQERPPSLDPIAARIWALLAFGPKLLWDFNVAISLAVIAVNLVFGYCMIITNKKYLDGLDELQRQLHLNAMAISLGVSVVFGAIYGLLEPARLLDATPSPSNILIVMSLSYFISLVINFRKYQ